MSAPVDRHRIRPRGAAKGVKGSLWNEQRTLDNDRTYVHSICHLDGHAPDHGCGGLSVSSKRVRAVGLVGPVRLGEVNPVNGEPDDGNIIYNGI